MERTNLGCRCVLALSQRLICNKIRFYTFVTRSDPYNMVKKLLKHGTSNKWNLQTPNQVYTIRRGRKTPVLLVERAPPLFLRANATVGTGVPTATRCR